MLKISLSFLVYFLLYTDSVVIDATIQISRAKEGDTAPGLECGGGTLIFNDDATHSLACVKSLKEAGCQLIFSDSQNIKCVEKTGPNEYLVFPLQGYTFCRDGYDITADQILLQNYPDNLRASVWYSGEGVQRVEKSIEYLSMTKSKISFRVLEYWAGFVVKLNFVCKNSSGHTDNTLKKYDDYCVILKNVGHTPYPLEKHTFIPTDLSTTKKPTPDISPTTNNNNNNNNRNATDYPLVFPKADNEEIIFAIIVALGCAFIIISICSTFVCILKLRRNRQIKKEGPGNEGYHDNKDDDDAAIDEIVVVEREETLSGGKRGKAHVIATKTRSGLFGKGGRPRDDLTDNAVNQGYHHDEDGDEADQTKVNKEIKTNDNFKEDEEQKKTIQKTKKKKVLRVKKSKQQQQQQKKKSSLGSSKLQFSPIISTDSRHIPTSQPNLINAISDSDRSTGRHIMGSGVGGLNNPGVYSDRSTGPTESVSRRKPGNSAVYSEWSPEGMKTSGDRSISDEIVDNSNQDFGSPEILRQFSTEEYNDFNEDAIGGINSPGYQHVLAEVSPKSRSRGSQHIYSQVSPKSRYSENNIEQSPNQSPSRSLQNQQEYDDRGGSEGSQHIYSQVSPKSRYPENNIEQSPNQSPSRNLQNQEEYDDRGGSEGSQHIYSQVSLKSRYPENNIEQSPNQSSNQSTNRSSHRQMDDTLNSDEAALEGMYARVFKKKKLTPGLVRRRSTIESNDAIGDSDDDGNDYEEVIDVNQRTSPKNQNLFESSERDNTSNKSKSENKDISYSDNDDIASNKTYDYSLKAKSRSKANNVDKNAPNSGFNIKTSPANRSPTMQYITESDQEFNNTYIYKDNSPVKSDNSSRRSPSKSAMSFWKEKKMNGTAAMKSDEQTPTNKSVRDFWRERSDTSLSASPQKQQQSDILSSIPADDFVNDTFGRSSRFGQIDNNGGGGGGGISDDVVGCADMSESIEAMFDLDDTAAGDDQTDEDEMEDSNMNFADILRKQMMY